MDTKNHAYALWIALRGLMDDEQGARTAIEEALVSYSNGQRANKLQESARRLRIMGDVLMAAKEVAALFEEQAAELLREAPRG